MYSFLRIFFLLVIAVMLSPCIATDTVTETENLDEL